jgi:hypothetical protein
MGLPLQVGGLGAEMETSVALWPVGVAFKGEVAYQVAPVVPAVRRLG